MGKTLKRIEATNQYPGINLGIVNKEFIQIIDEVIPSNNNQLKELDLGFFDDSDFARGEKYFMLINRYYNSMPLLNLRIKLEPNNLNITSSFYQNYNIRDYITSYCRTKFRNNLDTILVTIPRGDAVLIGINPVVKSGGSLIANDTIKSNTTLFDDMTIKDNVKLIIDRGKYYTIRDTVTLEGTGFITGAGYLNIEQNGAVKVNSWNQSVFKGRQINNPKIIWGRYPTSGTVTKYIIFRAKGNNQFIQIAEVDSTKRQFIDSTTIIYDRPEANQTYADYHVKAVYQPSANAPLSTSTVSNTIRYDMVDGIAPDKLAMNVQT
jgi:hypothetical protein